MPKSRPSAMRREGFEPPCISEERAGLRPAALPFCHLRESAFELPVQIYLHRFLLIHRNIFIAPFMHPTIEPATARLIAPRWDDAELRARRFLFCLYCNRYIYKHFSFITHPLHAGIWAQSKRGSPRSRTADHLCVAPRPKPRNDEPDTVAPNFFPVL